MDSVQIKVGNENSLPLPYSTFSSRLASQKYGEEVRVGKIEYRGKIDLAALAREIANSGFNLKQDTVVYVLQSMLKNIRQRLREGYIVDAGAVSFRAVMKGTFPQGKLFSSKQNKIIVRATVPPKMRDITSLCQVTCVDTVKTPMITEVSNLVDMESGILFGESNGRIKGKCLEFDPTASDEGIRIEGDGETFAVTILKIASEEVSFRITGSVERVYENATLTFATRGGDRNRSEPVTVSVPIILKPAE